jgi:replicative superfamily II helicase
MNKQDYINEIKSDLSSLINNSKLKNYLAQISAEKLGAEFNKTYNEKYLWEKSLFLSSNACFLLENELNNEIAIESLKLAAEIYENLSDVSKEYDNKYILLLSSLCYDLSGYQANAKCLIDKMENSEYYVVKKENNDSIDHLIKYENIILRSIQFFLQKKIFLLDEEIEKLLIDDYSFLNYYYKNFLDNFKTGLKDLCDFILYGFKPKNYISDYYTDYINRAYIEILYSGNIFLSHIMHLFKTRIKLFNEKSIWNVMNKYIDTNNYSWNTYFKLLSQDLYSDFVLKPKDERISTFEFWNSQLNALNQKILLNEDNYIIKMPTSAGKTFIAEILIINSLIKETDSKALYIAPFNALTHQVLTSFSKLNQLGFNISSLSGAYEINEFDELLIRKSDVLVSTPEKVDLIYRINPNFFENISIIIVDEGHIVGDGSDRSILLELLISKLKKRCKKSRFIYISALLSDDDAKSFSEWITNTDDHILSSPIITNEEWEPTRKLIGYLEWRNKEGSLIFPYKKLEEKNYFVPNFIMQNTFKYMNHNTNKQNTEKFPDDKKMDIAIELTHKLVNDGNILIFSPQPGNVEKIGEKFLDLINDDLYSDYNGFTLNSNELNSVNLSSKILGDNHTVTNCLRNGIAIHHGELPKYLRNAIEDDFKNNYFKILICTNTIGQGINFSIKTIIIHSLVITFDEESKKTIKISKRDFWNIVGRAGRAGKETEGQIIFLNLKDYDLDEFDKYTKDKNMVEPLKSFLFKIIETIVNNRLKEKYNNLISILEPSLINILFEESVDKLDEKSIEEILKYSLFYIQNENNNDLQQVTNTFKKIGNKFYSKKINNHQRKIYSTTGLSLDSCFKISKFIQDNLEEIKKHIIDKDYIDLIEKILTILIELDEMNNEKKIEKKLLNNNFQVIFDFIKQWIYGEDIDKLGFFWNNHVFEKKLVKRMNFFINQYLEFRYPWGANAFLLILLYYLDKKFGKIEDYPEEISNIPYFIKYGVNKNNACLCKNIGINDRKVCLDLDEYYEYEFEFQDIAFDDWLFSLEFENLKNFNFDNFQIKNILYSINKINKKESLNIGKSDLILKVEKNQCEYFDKLKVNCRLSLLRNANDFNMYNIDLKHENNTIASIPRHMSKFLAIDMDINNNSYEGLVIKKNQNSMDIQIKKI